MAVLEWFERRNFRLTFGTGLAKLFKNRHSYKPRPSGCEKINLIHFILGHLSEKF
jgi:hypothetical protein